MADRGGGAGRRRAAAEDAARRARAALSEARAVRAGLGAGPAPRRGCRGAARRGAARCVRGRGGRRRGAARAPRRHGGGHRGARRRGRRRRRCPSAPLLAAALRRAGLRRAASARSRSAATGSSARRPRASLAGRGRLAVDMESARAAAAGRRPPVAVVRVVVDRHEPGCCTLATVSRGRAALRTLAGSARRWSAGPAARGAAAGACSPRRARSAPGSNGPSRSSSRRWSATARRCTCAGRSCTTPTSWPTWSGAGGVRRRARRGAGRRAGGVLRARRGARGAGRGGRRGLAVVDATCPLVAKVHTRPGGRPTATRSCSSGTRPRRVRGHCWARRPAASALVETPRQASALEAADPEHVAYLTQTTLAEDEAAESWPRCATAFPRLAEPPTADICYATTNRQRAIRDIAADVDLVLVVGSPNSSNSLAWSRSPSGRAPGPSGRRAPRSIRPRLAGRGRTSVSPPAPRLRRVAGRRRRRRPAGLGPVEVRRARRH